jgi:hypothetical protein
LENSVRFVRTDAIRFFWPQRWMKISPVRLLLDEFATGPFVA